MTKPDIVMQYCVYCDYPLFRLWIKKYRDKFNKIIIYPSKQHGALDVEEFAKRVLPETWVDRIEIDYGVTDWRQGELDPCLKHVESDWIWFAEQDFFAKDWDKLFSDIEKASKTADMIGLWNPTHFPYIHPSCLIIKKEMFNKTNKDIRAHSEINGADHFSMLTRDVERLGGKIVSLQDMGYDCKVSPHADAMHLGSLTYTYQDWKDGSLTDRIGAVSPEAFLVYNYWMRKAPVEQSPEFLKLSEDIEKFFLPKFPDLDLQTSHWKEFFNG